MCVCVLLSRSECPSFVYTYAAALIHTVLNDDDDEGGGCLAPHPCSNEVKMESNTHARMMMYLSICTEPRRIFGCD